MLNAMGQRYQQGTEDANMANPLEYYAKGDEDIGWGGPSLQERMSRDFGNPLEIARQAHADLMHLLSQFGGRNPGLERVSDQEMMRRYPGLRLQYGTSDVSWDWTPEQLAIINRIRSNQEDYTFGPGSPNPSREDLGTYVGGPYAPASGFAVHRGVALAKKEYDLFTPEQRRALGIMDIAPADQAGKIERYYGRGVTGQPGQPGWAESLTGLPQKPMYAQVLPTPSGEPESGTNLYATAPTTVAASTTSKPEGFDVKGFGGSLSKIGGSLADQGEALVKQGGATGWSLLNSGWSNPYVNQDPLAFIRAFMQFGGGG
jgi:hypothetical protein